MKKFVKITSFIIAITIIVAALPMEAFAATSSSTTYLEIVEDNAPIRTSKSGAKNNNIIERLPKGTIIECTGSSRDWVGRKWYHVKHSDYSSGVIYSGNVKQHIHNYSMNVKIDSNTTMSICECGYYVNKTSGMVRTGYAVAPPAPLFDPATWAAVGAAVSGIGATISAAIPVIVVVGGVSLIVYFASTGESIKEVSTLEKVYYNDYGDLETGKYYIVNSIAKDCLIINPSSLTLDEATRHCRMRLKLDTPKIYKTFQNTVEEPIGFGDVYTLSAYDAEKLCQSVCKNGQYRYGNSLLILSPEVHKDQNGLQFDHYHFHSMFGGKYKMHILFDYPYGSDKYHDYGDYMAV